MAPEALWRPESLDELRDRADRAGAEALDTAECLALAIRAGAGPRAELWAGRLLARFGSLPEVLGADRPALEREATPQVARAVMVIHDLHRRALRAPLAARPVLAGLAAVSDYLRVVLAAERREQVRALFLDKRLRLIADEVLGRGTVDHAPVYPREVLRRALELGASGLVLAHNHPGGSARASPGDLDMTRQVAAAGAALRIALHDHLLVAGDEVVSFRAAGWL